MIAEKFGLTENAISKIRDANPSQVIGHYLDLKKHGTVYQACCPFHDEKSASFTVSDIKNIYKCFGCGAGGDAIRFVMEYDRNASTFLSACKKIAEICHIELEFEEKPFNKQIAEKQEAADLQEKVLNIVIPIYRTNLLRLPEDHPAKKDLAARGLTKSQIADWQLGWAGMDWQFITKILKEQNLYTPANKLGIIKLAESGKTYDGYRSRITIPIINQHGRYIGLGGRYIAVDPPTDGREPAKYINTPECELYNKSSVVFGLDKAARWIRQQEKAVLVEGYFDVINPASKDYRNVVATCGTAFTPEQMMLLRKHTDHLQLMRDNDKGGQDANKDQLPQLLKLGFQVEVIKYKEKDPDAWAKNLPPLKEEEKRPPLEAVDAVIDYAVNLHKAAGDNVSKKSAAKAQMLELLTNIKNNILRNEYLDYFSDHLGMRTGETRKEMTALLDAKAQQTEEDFFAPTRNLPKWLTDTEKEILNVNGYVGINKKIAGKPLVGYYCFGPQGSKIENTNFVVNPLFHVYAGTESRYLLQIDNGYIKSVLDMPARNIPSIEMFQAQTVAEGNFIIFCARNQWLRIASDLLHQFPRCEEITTLGWQPSGFYSFVDKAYLPDSGQLIEPDNWGIVEHNKTKYLIPPACEAYRHLNRSGRDPYENDRFLTYLKSPITFSQWAAKMNTVYGNAGLVGIAAVIMAIIRDLVYAVDNNCPHIWGFGEPTSGKSKWAESICAVFYKARNAFNLNSGTDYAFFSYMQRYTNAPSHMNEFDYEVIRAEWFEALKGIFDGEGREKGKLNAGAGSKNRTEVQRVLSLLILTGQKLITANDNSMVTRSIIEPFSITDQKQTLEAKNAYDDLKECEGNGLSSILIELLQRRKTFEADYKPSVNKLLGRWRKEKHESKGLNQRILQNYAQLSTCYTLASKFITMPATAEYFENYCFSQAYRWSNFIQNSDTLSEFWRTFEFLANQETIVEGWDFVIKEVTTIKLRKGNDEEVTMTFEEPTKILFFRLNEVHKHFQQVFRQRTGKEAMSMENLKHYFLSRKYYLGSHKKIGFKKWIQEVQADQMSPYGGAGLTGHTKNVQKTIGTSAYAFLYDDLNISIDNNPNLPEE